MVSAKITSRYRSHTCTELRPENAGETVRLAGWIFRKRNHGHLLFLDLRDHYGITQCVVDVKSPSYAKTLELRVESVVTLTGKVVLRQEAAINEKVQTGHIEVQVEELELLSAASVLPFPLDGAQEIPEEMRLRHRFLDLRRQKLHDNIALRAQVISSLRQRMRDAGFLEHATPILTSSSPEGARDYLVPSRVHPGKFYALPQAPQQFKQLLMVSGFDRYFQVAPCFRDEDARADRSPGEFYQLDIEMAFVEQDDIFAAIEPILSELYGEFTNWEVTRAPFPRIPYDEALAKYGSDKPDLRNPLAYVDATAHFAGSEFAAFAKAAAAGEVVRALRIPTGASKSRRFFDEAQALVRSYDVPGLAYLSFPKDAAVKGPIAKFLSAETTAALQKEAACEAGDAVLFVCGEARKILRACDKLRTWAGEQCELIASNCYRFAWIVDFPFYERDDDGNITFSHNPFSMPQGGLQALNGEDPLAIVAFQYDIVCNGVELSSGAIRNHRPDIMLRAFELAGYSEAEVEARFGGMINAFRFGAPPHGGLAPGIDRMVMQIAQEANIREVIAFPMNQQAQDLLMDAPAPANEKQLRELHLQLALPAAKPAAPA